MGEVLCGLQAEQRSSIVERLAAAQKSAPLSRRLVGEAAAACGVAEQHDVAVDRARRSAGEAAERRRR